MFTDNLRFVEKKDAVDLLRNLIRIQSHRETLTKENEIARFISDRLEKAGIEVKCREPAEGRPNVIAKVKGSGDGYSLMLTGHIDTVPAYNWGSGMDPFSAEVEKGKVFGRGACDMKGAVAAMIVALEAIGQSGIDLKGDLIFAGVVGEEGGGSIGAREIIKEGPKTDMAIVGEPTNLDIAIAQRGSYNFEITTYGKIAHTGCPERGLNAIVKMARVIEALQAKLLPEIDQIRHHLIGTPRMTVALINGGKALDVVPDMCKISINYRSIPGETVEAVEKYFSKILDDLRVEDQELKVELKELRRFFSWKYGTIEHRALPMEIGEHCEIVEALKRTIGYLRGKNPKVIGKSGWTDAAILVNEGHIPTAICGPGNNQLAHSPVEYLEIDQLNEAAKIYDLTALEVCLKEKEKV